MDLYGETGSRLPEGDWLTMSALCAALGHMEEADHWQRKWAVNQIASMSATDFPRLDGDLGRYAETSQGSLDWSAYLWNVLENSYLPRAQTGRTLRYRGWRNYSSLVDAVLRDDPFRQQLLHLAENLTPGWEDSRVFHCVTQYYLRSDQPRLAIELIERVLPGDQLLRERNVERLGGYLQACYAAGDYGRIHKILDALAMCIPVLRNPVAVQRLMVLRHEGQDEKADLLEQQLMANCRSPLNRWQPSSDARALIDSLDIGSHVYYRNRARRASEEGTRAALASAAGVSTADLDALPFSALRTSYARHNLYLHAARVIDLELKSAAVHNRPELLFEKAKLLQSAGRADEAKTLAREAERDLVAMIGQQPANGTLCSVLANVYASDAYGPDYERALDTHRSARERIQRRIRSG
jgi:hypothetical protein